MNNTEGEGVWGAVGILMLVISAVFVLYLINQVVDFAGRAGWF